MHARSGGNLEVMGLILGKVDGNTMIVMDSFALPVEGTETRVNAQAQAYEYMAAYIESAKTVSSGACLTQNGLNINAWFASIIHCRLGINIILSNWGHLYEARISYTDSE